MGGDIVVAPRRGGGTTFTLTVTLARAKRTLADGDALSAGGMPIRRCASSASRTIRSAASC